VDSYSGECEVDIVIYRKSAANQAERKNQHAVPRNCGNGGSCRLALSGARGQPLHSFCVLMPGAKPGDKRDSPLL